MKSITKLCLLLFMFVSTATYADIVKYVDENGTLVFADDIGKVPKKYRKNVIVDRDEPALAPISEQNQNTFDDKIIYICFYKQIEKLQSDRYDLTDFLAARNYNYRTLDISKNSRNLETCTELYCNIFTKQSPGYKINDCKRDASKMFDAGLGLPITFIGNKMSGSTLIDQVKVPIDEYFGVPTRTKVNWLD